MPVDQYVRVRVKSCHGRWPPRGPRRDGFVGGGNSIVARIGAQVPLLEPDHEVSLLVYEDNQAAIDVLEMRIESGKSPSADP